MTDTRPAQRIMDELGEEFWRELVGDFVATLDQRLAVIREAGEDHQAICDAAHSLKGAALGLDLKQLATASHEVERLARDAQDCTAAVAALNLIAGRTGRELRAALD